MKLPELKSALADHIKIGEQIASLTTLQQKASDKLADLEASGDLEDEKTLAKIGNLRVQLEFIPSRLAALESAQATALESLLAGTEEFAEQTLRPKVTKLLSATSEKLKQTLRSIYSGEQLENQIKNSDAIQALVSIAHSLQRDSQPSSPIQYVERRIGVLEKLAEIEKAM